MAGEFEIKVTGLRETQRALYAYSQQLGDKVVIDSLKQGARLVQKGAKARAPVRTGRLKRGIVVKKSKLHNGRRSKLLGVFLTLRKGRGKRDPRDAFYGRWIEDGWTDRGGNRQPGRHFMQGAFNALRGQAVQLIVASVIRGAELVKRRTGLK